MNSLLTQASHGLLSWLQPYLTGNSLKILLALFVLQFMVALLVTAIALRLLPEEKRAHRRSAATYFFVFSMLVPFGALLICLPSIWVAKRYPLGVEQKGVGEVALPEFVPQLVSLVKHGGGARLAVQLGNVDAPVAERLTALVAMQTMQTRTASPILRGLLSDSVEDVRLLVYGMLDGAEKEITKQIHTTLPLLTKASSDVERYTANKLLAQLYWELIYQNLVQDDIYRYTAEQAENYAGAALAIDGSSASLWYMRARLALMRHDCDAADAHLEAAARFRFPHDRLLPRQAEAAYLRGDYEQVRIALRGFHNQSTLPFLKPLQRYWTS